MFLLVVVLLLFATPVFGQTKDWQDLGNGISVYGYRKNYGDKDLLIECDSGTGKETGNAFWAQKRVKEKDVFDHWNYIKKEDFSIVSEVQPVKVKRIFAPNIPTNEFDSVTNPTTGEKVVASSGMVSWPGDNFARIVPGTNPAYWLIVAEVKNPNPFPVKAEVRVAVQSMEVKEEIKFRICLRVKSMVNFQGLFY